MLIEQNVKFELRDPGPSGRISFWLFHEKTKISKENLRIAFLRDFCFFMHFFMFFILSAVKTFMRRCFLLPPIRAKQITCN